MHRITLLSVGKIKTSWIAEGCDVYLERLGHSCEFNERVISMGSKEEENGRLLKALEKTEGAIIALDETGKEFSSKEFAILIGKERDIGRPMTFILGGAYGLDAAVKAKATLTFSLSRMTLPHELCKLVFLEQLYRAHSILAGTGYHH